MYFNIAMIAILLLTTILLDTILITTILIITAIIMIVINNNMVGQVPKVKLAERSLSGG